MAVSPTSSSSLELTISMPGFSSFPSSRSSSGDHHRRRRRQGCCGYGVRNLDINQVPSAGTEEELSEDDAEIITTGALVPPRKKLRLSKEQSRLLEESFRQHHTLNPRQKEALALQLKLRPRQVEVWFQNRRARSKLKQTEMECEFLKRRFGSLTEQNRRLQKEVEELRAMKVGPPTVISAHTREPLPAPTLTMCPRCERITTTTTTTTTSTANSTKNTRPPPTAAALSSKVETPAALHLRQPSMAS